MPDGSPPPGSDWTRHIVLLLLGAGLIGAYVVTADPQAVLAEVLTVGADTLLLATGLAALAVAPRILSLSWLSRATSQGLGPASTTRAALGSNALNLLLPARIGDALLVASLSRDRGSADSTALVVAWRGLSLLSLVALTAVILAYGLLSPGRGLADLWIVLAATPLVAAVLGLVVAGVAARGVPAGRWVLDRLEGVPGASSVRGWLANFAQAFSTVLEPRSVLAPTVALAVVWFADIGVAAVFVQALTPEVPWLVAFAAPVLASLSRVFRLTPGGLGVYEGVLSTLLVLEGVQLDAAVAAATLGHLFLNVVTLVIGAVPAYQITHRTSATVQEAVGEMSGDRSPQ